MTDEPMPDAQWHCLHSFLSTCPDIRVGQEEPCRLFVEAARWMARSGTTGRRWPPEYGKWNSVYRRFARGCARGVWPRLMAYLQAKPEPEPELSAGLLDSTRRARPKRRGWIPPSGVAEAASAPRSTSWRINGDAPCVCA